MDKIDSKEKSDFAVRKFCQRDFYVLYKWQADEGWNIGEKELIGYYKINPDGWFAIDKKETLVGCVAGYQHDGEYAVVGIVITSPAYRQKGIGTMLMTVIQQYLKFGEINENNVIVNSVPGLGTFYGRFGLTNAAFHLPVYYGVPDISTLPSGVDGVMFVSEKNNLNHLDDFLSYDTKMHSTSRRRYWELMLQNRDKYCYVAKKGEVVVGIGTIQPAVVGYKIGPLYADDVTIAGCLLKRLYIKAKNVIGKENIQNNPVIELEAFEGAEQINLLEKTCKIPKKSYYLTRLQTFDDLPDNCLWGKVYSVANPVVHNI